MKRTAKAIISLMALFTLLLSVLRLVHLRSKNGLRLWVVKLTAGAQAPFMVIGGLVSGLLGIWLKVPIAVLAGVASAALSARYVQDVVTTDVDYTPLFGPDWPQTVAARRTPAMLPKPWTWWLSAPPAPRLEQDLVFATVPGTDRDLLCDLWQPALGVKPSGLAVIYCHGSGWYLSDKDMGTRPFFRHLAAQGHVVMDVAYRMCPETDVLGMVADVKAAVAWMKAHAADYGADPDRVILSGGSAGAHLAMLAAFAPNHPALTPAHLADRDLSVRGLVSFYGPPDMRAIIQHNGSIGLPAYRADLAEGPIRPPARPSKEWQAFQALQWKRVGNLPWDMFGGTQDDVPEMYDLASPITHIHAGCPPTLLIQGGQDILVPVTSVRTLRERMMAAGAPVAYLELPNTDHAFDLVLPQISPPAQAAWFQVDRFLALVG